MIKKNATLISTIIPIILPTRENTCIKSGLSPLNTFLSSHTDKTDSAAAPKTDIIVHTINNIFLNIKIFYHYFSIYSIINLR